MQEALHNKIKELHNSQVIGPEEGVVRNDKESAGIILVEKLFLPVAL